MTTTAITAPRPETLTPAQAADRLGLNEEYVRQLLRTARLGGHKDANGHWLLTPDDIEARLRRLAPPDPRVLVIRWLALLIPAPGLEARLGPLLTDTFPGLGPAVVEEILGVWRRRRQG